MIYVIALDNLASWLSLYFTCSSRFFTGSVHVLSPPGTRTWKKRIVIPSEMNCNIVSPESNYLKQMKRISPRIQFYPFKLLSVIITESEAMEWMGTQRLSCGTYSSSHILNRNSLLPAPGLTLDQGSERVIVGCFDIYSHVQQKWHDIER